MCIKAELRRELLSSRTADKSDKTRFWREFVQTKIYTDCKTLLTYVSVKDEPDTRGLIEHALLDCKRVFVPKTYGSGRMTFYRINHCQSFRPSAVSAYPSRAATVKRSKTETATGAPLAEYV